MKALLSTALVTALLVGLAPAAAPAASARARLSLQTGNDDELAGIATAPLATALRDEAGIELVTPSLLPDSGERCDFEVTCRIRRSGYRIAARVVDASSQSVGREVVTGGEEDVFDLIDQLGQRLARRIVDQGGPHRTVAVLEFETHAGADSRPLASGLPDMLMTVMRQNPEITLLERAATERGALARSDVRPANLSVADAAELSRWLGADLAVSGALTDLLDVELGVTAADGSSLASVRRTGPRTAVVELLTAAATELAAKLGPRLQNPTVAVLPFANHGDESFGSVVRGLPDMLTTALGQASGLTVIERVQIDKALRNFHLEMSGPIDAGTAVEVGAWLGADAVIVGSFLRFGRVFRIDARMIDARTGEVVVAESARGGEDDVLAMIDSLGQQLRQQFSEKQGTDETGTGTLRVLFRTSKSEMGERPVYHHICKLYVDGEFMGLSQIVDQTERWTPLFDQNLRSGSRRVEIVHGYVRDGEWDGQMPRQPERFFPVIETDGVTSIQYTYSVGWFDDQFVYEP